MAGLQRSVVSFRRQGSSGLVWDDRFLSEEINQVKQEQLTKQLQQEEQGQLPDNKPEKIDVIKDVKPTGNIGPINTFERSQSNGERRDYCTSKVSPLIEPSSPKVSAGGFCSAFGKQTKNHRKTSSKRRSR